VRGIPKESDGIEMKYTSAKMDGKVFVDSNIFLYTLDSSEKTRREKAKARLVELSGTNRIVISTQVLNEVYAVATRKLGVEVVMAKRFVRQLCDFDVIVVTQEVIDAAMDCSILHQLNYWDALMIAAAELARCSVLWTEDLNPGEMICGVRIVNPLV
jgi:predicted nucleic acid-binding protein